MLHNCMLQLSMRQHRLAGRHEWLEASLHSSSVKLPAELAFGDKQRPGDAGALEAAAGAFLKKGNSGQKSKKADLKGVGFVLLLPVACAFVLSSAAGVLVLMVP